MRIKQIRNIRIKSKYRLYLSIGLIACASASLLDKIPGYVNSAATMSSAAHLLMAQDQPTPPAWKWQKELDNPNNEYADNYGYAVAIDGNTAVIASPGTNTTEGVVYVYIRNGGDWVQQQELRASDGSAYFGFGSSVAIQNDTILVGSMNANRVGAAYVYQRTGTKWREQAKLRPDNGSNGDRFGTAVAFQNEIAVIGAPNKSGNIGSAYLFART